MNDSEKQPEKSLTISNAEVIYNVWVDGRKKFVWPDNYFAWVRDNWTSRGEPLDFDKHKYLVEIYKDQSPFIALMKSAQTGATERFVTEAVYIADTFKENAVYLFPTSASISDLVQERVDEPLNGSRYLREVSGRVKKRLGKQADKVGLKRMSKGFVYFRGSNKPNQITSVPADVIFADEVDRMLVTSIPYFTKRLGHSQRKWQRWASTPTIPNYGIHRIFLDTDQKHYYITCRNCNEKQELDFYRNIEYKMKNEKDCEWARLICFKCRETIIPWECDGEWIAQNPSSPKRGYFISKLYSPNADLRAMVEESLKTAEWEVQQFFNQELGLPYEPKGAKITDEVLNSCKREYSMGPNGDAAFMGVDVGKRLHVIIQSLTRVLLITTVENFEDLDTLMSDYNVRVAVLDALPETRKAQEFCNRFKGRAYICYYAGLKEVKKNEWFKREEGNIKINTDRTLSLDMWTDRLKQQKTELPRTLNDLLEFKSHMQNLTRVVSKGVNGNPRVEYLETGPDHYYHAGNYSNIARAMYEKSAEPEIFVI